jgi:hypothetical protein
MSESGGATDRQAHTRAAYSVGDSDGVVMTTWDDDRRIAELGE